MNEQRGNIDITTLYPSTKRPFVCAAYRTIGEKND